MEPSIFPPTPTGHDTLAEWLTKVENAGNLRRTIARRREIAWSWARLFSFLLLIYGFYFGLSHSGPLGALFAVTGAILFAFSLRKYQIADREVESCDRLTAVVQESRDRLAEGRPIIRNGKSPAQLEVWRRLYDARDGRTSHFPLSPQEIDDLDIFGETLSLYGALNRASSPVAESRLALALTNPLLDADAIRKRQEAVRHLAARPADRLQLLSAAFGLRKLHASIALLYQALRDAQPMPNPKLVSLLRLWGLAAPLALLFAIVTSGDGPLGWIAFVVILFANATFASSRLDGARERLRPWLNMEPVIGELRRFAESATLLPAEGQLGRARAEFAAALDPACLPKLHRWVPLTYFGLSGITHTLMDWLVFWDLQLLGVLERIYLPNRDKLIAAIAALGDCEMLACLAAFAGERPNMCWPQFNGEHGRPAVANADAAHLEIREGRHPLIAPADAVANSLALTPALSTWVITGSNMSGKSTFLRMVGTNTLLAQVGSAVPAAEMQLSPLHIITDLRIRDDLSRKESYFLAEVRQVKKMIEAAIAREPVLTLIDEPFRGTNSAERVAAASAVIKALMSGGGLHLIATHDAALAQMETQGRAANYHFEESFESDQLVFDYKLRPGPARGRNALRVLEAEGYPADLLESARRSLNELVNP